MTEAEWLNDDDPERWIYPERTQGMSERKLRLFCVACCHRIWSRIRPDCRSAVALGEAFADGRADSNALRGASDAARGIAGDADGSEQDAADAAASCAEADIRTHVFPVSVCAAKAVWVNGHDRTAELTAQAELLRDIFRNPFRPIALSPSWRTDTAVVLAQQMYESREFSPMPNLADALQDAGCDSADILDHCRGPGPHVRGCWVVDLVLGKE